MMDFRKLFPNERPDESIFVFARPYFLAFLPWLLIGIALIFIGIFFVFFTPLAFPDLLADPMGYNIFVVITSAYFLLIIPFMTVAFIDFYYDIHIVTDRRLVDIDQNNLFSREINELALEEVQDATATTKGVLGSIFDFGDVTIQTSGAQQLFVFDNVLHPREIASVILDLADQAKQRVEGGAAEIAPKGATKGVINGKVISDFPTLESMGAMIGDYETTPAPRAGTAAAESPSDLEPAGEPAEPTPPPPPAPKPESPKPADQGNGDLDIVIDDPTNKK